MTPRLFSLPLLFLLLALAPRSAYAAEGGGLLSVHPGLVLWPLLIFGTLIFLLAKFAFGPLTAVVRQREKELLDSMDQARREREEAGLLLAETRKQLDAARGEADKLILEGRSAGEKLRGIMLEETRQQQTELLDRARREIANERDSAIAQLRREAVDLAIAGAGKVIEKNLDDAGNRKLVEGFLASLSTTQEKVR
jgi:F-type H+-transporting ATPase subunit b